MEFVCSFFFISCFMFFGSREVWGFLNKFKCFKKFRFFYIFVNVLGVSSEVIG